MHEKKMIKKVCQRCRGLGWIYKPLKDSHLVKYSDQLDSGIVRPTVMCPVCDGSGEEQLCAFCNGKGKVSLLNWVSIQLFKRKVIQF